MIKCFYKTKFSFLCTPIDIVYFLLNFTVISSFMRDGVEHPTSYVEASRKGEAQRAEQ